MPANSGMGPAPSIIPAGSRSAIDPNQPAAARNPNLLGGNFGSDFSVIPGRPPEFNPFVDPFNAASGAVPRRPDGTVDPNVAAENRDFGQMLYSQLQARARFPQGMANYNRWFLNTSDYFEDQSYGYKRFLDGVDDRGRNSIAWW